MAFLIPTFDQLLDQLGYGTSSRPRSEVFQKGVEKFIREFISSDGERGIDLRNWFVYKDAFNDMARLFLEDLGGGRHFWPDLDTPASPIRLKYAVNQADIMTQLFFRAINTSPPYKLHIDQDSRLSFTSRASKDYTENLHKISKFTYTVWRATKFVTFVSDWQPQDGFQVSSLSGLMSRLPGARDATGIRISMKGPGFFITQSCFGEDDFDRLMGQSAKQIDRCLALGVDGGLDNYGLHTDFILLTGQKPSSRWIFSGRGY
ncbi:hypothetical protein M441DRAFT_32385 [Trichoderma asperellum CBS 433.97]|uniref:Uncharacterized protein n=1 Tax=Trichoderma asperellum (strain ATCC 204424 / CBS 433.97 / NBRC 101777) TaxID=1042311 RepID=A0A2T3YQT1_TRIA4|nr:hypothetical protein M441DRAFT_32385 [Trichoderma asperellum CBS 433.97]PTB34930.1 hypothetical protein M441DRAFT_32385 [Trichoderma asperellum CBS 433.97]